jgi:hypothetical protein
VLGNARLFPRPKDPTRPITRELASALPLRAERRAKLPELERGLFHPYRRLIAVEGMALPNVGVARAGGWRDLTVMKRSYQRPRAATVLRLVESVGGRTPPGTQRGHSQHRRSTGITG